MSSNWTCSSKLCFLKKLPQFFPWGTSVRIVGKHTTGSAVKNHITSEMARELIAVTNYVPFVVPGLSASSSSTTPSPTPSPSSSQESTSANRENRDIVYPVSERSRGTNGEPRGNPLQESRDITGESEEVPRFFA